MAQNHPNTLKSPYNFNINYPKEETAVEYILNSISTIVAQPDGEQKRWVTNTETGEQLLYSDVHTLSRKIASSFYKRGMRKGDVVLYSTHDPARLHCIFLGIWQANGTLRAVYPEEDQKTILERVIESKVKWILCDAHASVEAIAAAQNCPWPVEVIVFGQNPNNTTPVDQLFEDDGLACPKLEIKGEDVAVILATSGTTGKSKGCLLTQVEIKKTFHLLKYLVNHGDAHATQPQLIMGRPTHISGFAFPFLAAAGATSMLMLRNAVKENIFNAVHKYKPNLVFGFPKYLLYLANDPDAVNYDLTSIQFVLSGGLVLTPSWISTMQTLPNVQTVVVLYGMTENMTFTASRNLDPATHVQFPAWTDVPPFSVGKLIPRTMLQVRDVDTGEPLPANQQGELCFRTDIMCAGYLNRPEETAATFPNGWIRTGDCGYYDDKGFVYVVDRVKEIFKYYNNHISPSELENVIQRHPAVDNVCVVGIPDPDGGDTIPRAFVTLKDPQALAADIKKFANDNLAPYKHLRGGLIVLNEMPVGKSGKFNTAVLKQFQISM